MEAIRNILKYQSPTEFYIDGACSANDLKLFYKKDDETKCITFPCRNHQALNDLYYAGDKASFGKGDEDVYDPSYRKARKIDATSFSLQFCPYKAGIINRIKREIIPVNKGVRAELYKVNIYKKGGFFKPHVDTPRSSDMFGTLVVCLPTDHKGGHLRLSKYDSLFDKDNSDDDSDGDEEFNSKESHSFYLEGQKHCIRWAAFFSDVTHQVLHVTQGFRVTVSYNLYYEDTDDETTSAESKSPLKDKMLELAPLMTGKGQVYGYCFENRYPVKNTDMAHEIVPYLRGRDLEFYEACKELKFQVHPVVIHDIIDNDSRLTKVKQSKYLKAHFCSVDEFLDCPLMECHLKTFPKDKMSCDTISFLTQQFRRGGHNNFADYEDCRDRLSYHIAVEDCEAHGVLGINWLNSNTTQQFGNKYGIYYGNESGVGRYYSSAGFIVKIP